MFSKISLTCLHHHIMSGMQSLLCDYYTVIIQGTDKHSLRGKHSGW